MNKMDTARALGDLAARWERVGRESAAVAAPSAVTLWYPLDGSLRRLELARRPATPEETFQSALNRLIDELGAGYAALLANESMRLEAEVDRLQPGLAQPVENPTPVEPIA